MSLSDWFTGPDADYDLDDARTALAEEAQRPARPRFDACFGCSRYLPLPRTGRRRFCAECAPLYEENARA